MALLTDLRELAVRTGRRDEIEGRVGCLYEQHAKKPSLIERLLTAGPIGTWGDERPGRP